MKIPIEQALEITQMIVPEIELSYKKVGNSLHITGIPIEHWHFYLNAMENASDMLLTELDKLPDVPPITEIEPIATDINCLITCFNMFYFGMIKELKASYEKSNSSSNPDFKRYSRYRRDIQPPERDE